MDISSYMGSVTCKYQVEGYLLLRAKSHKTESVHCK